tara:strand:+ start:175 stop:501 length:327 start_codon:yes stop_codon:yes gene_type:complete
LSCFSWRRRDISERAPDFEEGVGAQGLELGGFVVLQELDLRLAEAQAGQAGEHAREAVSWEAEGGASLGVALDSELLAVCEEDPEDPSFLQLAVEGHATLQAHEARRR